MTSHSQYKVRLFFEVQGISLTKRNNLKRFIEKIFTREKRRLDSLNYIFCSDKTLLKINRDWLKHDFYTDIITFELSQQPESTIGEIYISMDRVRENAKIHGVSLKSELHRVIFHGALHLCGHSDKTKADSLKMRSLEEKYLHLFHVEH